MIIAITVILAILVAAIVGVVAYVVIGTWVAALTTALGSIIAGCVTYGIVEIVKAIKKKK